MATNLLSTVWTAVLFSAGGATFSTNGEPDTVRPMVSIKEASEATPISTGGDPAQLLRCQTACKQGGQSLKNFCATVPQPAMRSTCYGFLIVGEVACLGWCYNYWGS